MPVSFHVAKTETGLAQLELLQEELVGTRFSEGTSGDSRNCAILANSNSESPRMKAVKPGQAFVIRNKTACGNHSSAAA